MKHEESPNWSFSKDHACSYKVQSPILEIKTYSYGVISFVIIILGIIGNILTLMVFRRNPKKTSSVICIIGKTAVDLITVILAIPWAIKYWASRPAWKSFWWAYFHCHLNIGLWNAFVGAGTLFMMVITIERFLSMKYPLKFRAQNNPINNVRGYIVSGTIPIFSLVCFIPQTFKSEIRQIVEKDEGKVFVCCDHESVMHSSLFSLYIWSQQVIFRFVPVIFISIFNLMMVIHYKKIRQKREEMKNGVSGAVKGAVKKDQSPLTKMLLAFSVIFLVCSIPSAIVLAVNSDEKKRIVEYQIFRAVSNVLEIIGYSSPFYVYCLSSKEFRKKLMHTVKSNNTRVEPTVALAETKSVVFQ